MTVSISCVLHFVFLSVLVPLWLKKTAITSQRITNPVRNTFQKLMALFLVLPRIEWNFYRKVRRPKSEDGKT